MSETAALLNIELAESESFDKIIEQARMQMVSVSLGTAIDLQQSMSREQDLEREKEELSVKANTDKLTGIKNRSFFDERLKAVIADHARGEKTQGLGLLVLDIDHFKSFNDTHGHLAGDEVLKAVAHAVDDAVRGDDVAARYGGEEFVVILPETEEKALFAVAERIRTAVETVRVEYEGKTLEVTASIGGAVCTVIERAADGPALLKIADECLYEAKEGGRNRSICKTVSTSLV